MSGIPSLAPVSTVHHVDALPPGTRLGEFEVLSLLGVGGFGMVYQAFDHSLLRFVAIKEYMPSALAGRAQGQSLWVRSSSDAPSFQAGLASFVGEARLLAQFDHPSLVKVFRFWEANHTAYMVMPLYGGMTLKQARTHMRTPPSEAWLRKVLWSVLGAMRVLHEGQTLHRDISPDNIFLQDSGAPVLLDLGAARHAINDQDRKHTAVLKINYAPIEQYTDADAELVQGPWSDLYSLAAVVHGCLCNDTPLPATLRSIRDRMVPFSRVVKTVRKQFGVEYSPAFVTAISQALALRPEDRPQSIDAFLRAMHMESAPEGWEHFDFRAELGDVWVEPSSKEGPGVATPMVDITSVPAPQVSQPLAAILAQRGAAREKLAQEHRAPDAAFAATVAVDAGDTVIMEAGDTVFQAHDPAPVERRAHRRIKPDALSHQEAKKLRAATAVVAAKPRGRGLALWIAMGSVAMVAVVAALWWSQPQRPRYTPDSEIITELAEPAGVVALNTELLPVAYQESEASGVAVTGASESASGPVPAFVVAPQSPRPKAIQRRASEAPSVIAQVDTPAPLPEPTPAPPPLAAPRPAAAVRTLGPEEVCADSSFLARPMCIHRECQKAGAAQQPVCVESRRRQDEEERRRQMSSQ